jgi:hypothetical protein
VAVVKGVARAQRAVDDFTKAPEWRGKEVGDLLLLGICVASGRSRMTRIEIMKLPVTYG